MYRFCDALLSACRHGLHNPLRFSVPTYPYYIIYITATTKAMILHVNWYTHASFLYHVSQLPAFIYLSPHSKALFALNYYHQRSIATLCWTHHIFCKNKRICLLSVHSLLHSLILYIYPTFLPLVFWSSTHSAFNLPYKIRPIRLLLCE